MKKVIMMIVMVLSTVFLSQMVMAEQQNIVLEWHNDASWHEPGQEAIDKAALEKMGIGIKSIFYPDTSTYQVQMQLALVTAKAPALFDWWFGYRMRSLVESGLVVDITSIWEKHIAQGEYPRSFMDSFGAHGKAYAAPKMADYYVMFYNKSVFDKYGLKPPDAWSEFLLIAEKLKSQGVTPIGTGAGTSWESLIWFEELILRIDPKVYTELMDGKIKYNDPRVVEAMNIWGDMIKKGYFTEAGSTSDMRNKSFAQGKIGMVLGGTWYGPILDREGFTDYGVFIMPGITEKGKRPLVVEGRPILIAANSPNQEEALKLIDFFMSVEGQTIFAKALGINSANLKVPAETRPAFMRGFLQELADGKYDLYTRYWEATPKEIVEPVVEFLQKFFIDPDKLDEVLEDATRAADSYWAEKE